jgi:hypothetical protein
MLYFTLYLGIYAIIQDRLISSFLCLIVSISWLEYTWRNYQQWIQNEFPKPKRKEKRNPKYPYLGHTVKQLSMPAGDNPCHDCNMAFRLDRPSEYHYCIKGGRDCQYSYVGYFDNGDGSIALMRNEEKQKSYPPPPRPPENPGYSEFIK